MRTVVAAPVNPACPLPTGVHVVQRPSDWGLSPLRRSLQLARWAVHVARIARRYERVVLLTAGLELFPVALLAPRATCLVAVDWIMPRAARLNWFGWLLRRVHFVVIRRADEETLGRRFGVSKAHVAFVPLPAPSPEGEACNGDYFYSAGWAYRDWPTLLKAQRVARVHTKIAARVDADQELVDVLGPLAPDAGRTMMRKARAVVLPMLDTDLPSGPLVLLDAMAHGKAVVVSDVGGSRDYVTDDVDALVVPPGDALSLAEALRRLDRDPILRARLGAAAATRTRHWSAADFWKTVLDSG